MVLTAEQQWKVANTYEIGAAASIAVPPQQRAAFAHKASWFRMLALIKAKKEAGAVFKPALKTAPLTGPRHTVIRATKPRYLSLEERLCKSEK